VPHLYSAANLHGTEGALEERASVLLAVLKRAGALCQQALRSRRCASMQPPTSPARSAQPRGVVAALWRWVVVGGGGRTGRRRAGRASGGGYAKRRCGRGAAKGRGWVRTLWGAVETGVAENEVVEEESNEEARRALQTQHGGARSARAVTRRRQHNSFLEVHGPPSNGHGHVRS